MTGPSKHDNAMQIKAQVRAQWDEAAEGWDAHRLLLRDWLGDATARMLDAAHIAPGAHVLDVAAGTGDQTLDLAERVGPSGYVLATDLSPRCVELAEINVMRAGYRHVDVQVTDGETLDMTERFDAVICRLGLMFYPDPASGVSQMSAALKPGGTAAALVFSDAVNNPCIAATIATALKHNSAVAFDPHRAGGLLSLGRPGLMTALFEQAGFVDVETHSLSAPMRLAGVDDYLQFLRTSAGPVLHLLAGLDAPMRTAAWADMRNQLQQFDTADGWTGPNELLLTWGLRL
jgi:ubiquinone/menaquinone biosynthesis C-methylase UbiE